MVWTLSTVEVHWKDHAKNEDLWNVTRVLYAYIHPKLHEQILYIGKADGTTVGERFDADDKHSLWDDIEREFGLLETDLKVIVGEFKLPDGKNLTSELIADIEARLIEAEQPRATFGQRTAILRTAAACSSTALATGQANTPSTPRSSLEWERA